MKPLRILIADDHDVARRSVRAALEGESTWVVCGEAKTRLETLARTVELSPDVVILDVDLLGPHEVWITQAIRRIAPTAMLVVLDIHTSQGHEDLLYAVGAHAYLSKVDVGHRLIPTITALVSKEGLIASREQEPVESADLVDSQQEDTFASLTLREREVMQLLAEGRSNKEIATALNISAKTVETHRARIMSKLNLHSMNELVRYAIRHRLIAP
jgi:DNA-binding NarL/FixJ family response regulator